jgi:hypothetical protein
LQWIFPFASKFYLKKENGEKGWVEWHTHHARHHKLITNAKKTIPKICFSNGTKRV